MIGEESLFANYILISAQTNRVSPAVVVKDTAAVLNCFIFVSLTLRSLIFLHKKFKFLPQEQNSLIFLSQIFTTSEYVKCSEHVKP